MQSRLRRAIRVTPYLLSGVALTLFMAWGMPLLLAMRGLGPSAASSDVYRLATSPVGASASSVVVPDSIATVEVRRGVFSDWCIVEPGLSHSELPPARIWPLTALYGQSSPTAVQRSAPLGCVLAPSEVERDQYARIDTGLSGWPFRAFASEAWFQTNVAGDGYDPFPEHRWNVYLGDIGGRQTLVALRPLPVGLIADVAFWAGASFLAISIPHRLRRRKWERFGRCGACGHTLDPHLAKRPAACPECSAPLPRDPLGFARSPEMHFQNAYVWLVFVSSLDIMLTWKILDRGGLEVNPVAKLVIDAWGMHGAIAFKFALMLWVIVVCEILARLRLRAGRFLAYTAVAISASPVAWSLFLLAWHELVPQ